MNYTFCFFKQLLKGPMRIVALMILATTLFCTQNANAVVSWHNNGVYYENFDSLTNVEGIDSIWLNEVTLSDWYSNSLFIRADKGATSSGSKMMSYGSMGSTDRALGSHINSGVSVNFQYGMKLVNDSIDDINSFTVRYTGEQWRAKTYTGSTTEKLRFSYAIGNALLAINLGTYVFDPSAAFISPNLSNVGAVNGNLDENSDTYTVTVSGINWGMGDYLMLRWDDYTERTGVDNDGLAIDDVYFTTSQDLNDFNVSHTGVNFESVPEPSTIGLFSLVSIGALIAAKRRKKRVA